MKTLFITIGLGILLGVSLAFQNDIDNSKSKADVNQLEGLYIFVDSKPIHQYEYLGTVKVTMTWDSQYSGVRNKMIEKCKKQFPQADGIIFNFKTGGVDKADAIKFK